jgi:hypothetical protein
MRAFEVRFNNKTLCVAGVDADGVLTAIVSWVTGKDRDELFLDVGGRISPTSENLAWIRQKRVEIGDEIRVKIVQADSVDEPAIRERDDPAKRLRAQKNYVRTMAKQFGWKVQAKTRTASTRSSKKR